MMRTRIALQEGWQFIKADTSPAEVPDGCETVNLPHTWNAEDGCDGDNDYYRGACLYYHMLPQAQLSAQEELWLECTGAAISAQVYLNGQRTACHEGGFSTFRVNLTDHLQKGENLLALRVDNGENRTVYPQKADFTFYGGLYREVTLIRVPKVHFALEYYGGCGLKVTPVVSDDFKSAVVTLEAWISGVPQANAKREESRNAHDAGSRFPEKSASETMVVFSAAGQEVSAPVKNGYACAQITIDEVRLWDGIKDPYVYMACARLCISGNTIDEVQTSFGCRSFRVDPQQGFFLNGRSYPLCGAARHQDRAGMGNALTEKEHLGDMEIMREMGCNTIRLAHYQHAQYFYDLCDRYGMVVWAEIPYITQHMEEGKENVISQMKELIIQNYHHPSIVCWGLSNEITASGGVRPEITAQHEALNRLCHTLDPTRLTTMAHAFMLDMDESFVRLSDICSYNLYYGWYVGEVQQNDAFFDTFHERYPDYAVGLSEFGADANPAYQNAHPSKGDWSEPYQALYHEHMLQMWKERPWIWAMHVWNMFDFAADGRAEGGKPGQNQKGLVTFDRKLKKDAFYLYKAYLSTEPFVHLCGRRYVDRTEEITEIKVYSNQEYVTLLVDGAVFETAEGEHIFRFRVPIHAEHQIQALSGALSDEMKIRKVPAANPDYFYGGKAVVNWFDRDDEIVREGYFSIKDSMGDVQADPQANAVMQALLMPALNRMSDSYGDVAKGVTMSESMVKMMEQMSLEAWMKQAAKFVTPDLVHQINYELNQIKKN